MKLPAERKKKMPKKCETEAKTRAEKDAHGQKEVAKAGAGRWVEGGGRSLGVRSRPTAAAVA